MVAELEHSDAPRVSVRGEPEGGDAAFLFETVRRGGHEPDGMHRVLAVVPETGIKILEVALSLRNSGSLPRRFRELVILRTVQIEGGAHEFSAHRPMALAHGLSQDQVDSLHRWRGSNAFDEADEALLDYVDALSSRTPVSAEIYATAIRHFAPADLVLLTMTAGFYTLAARLSNGLNIP